ncbi:hypothetical protein Q8F55_005275 [Vanrija albida]|uniref:Uncharacterized protein n=1 Tax=Vanrija albida TaxID=181172 RepID=A0ABR3Q1C5_9TREE
MATGKVDPAHNRAGIKKPELETVTKGYYPYTDITFLWADILGGIEGYAVLQMISGLSEKGNPLCREGQDHADLYICEFADGTKKVCLSLQQVQFIQFYTFTKRFTDVAYVEYLDECAAWKEGMPKPQVPPVDPTIKPIPLPPNLIPACYVTRVEIVPCTEKYRGRDLHKQLSKHNKQILKDKLAGISLSVVSATPSVPSPSSPSLKGEDTAPSSSSSTLNVEDETTTLSDGDAVTDDETDTTAEDQEDEPALSFDPASAYFFNVRNSYSIAVSGGVAGTLGRLSKSTGFEINLQALPAGFGPSTGRGLFVAFDVRFDPVEKTYIDVGYAAYWFENTSLEGSGTHSEDEMPELRAVFQRKHWLVKSAIGTSVSADVDGGTTTPIDPGEVSKTIESELATLWHKSGRGAIYVVTNSPDHRTHGVSGTEVGTFDGPEEEAVHTTPLGVQKRFEIDLAKLINTVEQKDGRHASARKLEDVMSIVCPEVPVDANDSNAGNYAHWLMTAFDAFMGIVHNTSIADVCAIYDNLLIQKTATDAAKQFSSLLAVNPDDGYDGNDRDARAARRAERRAEAAYFGEEFVDDSDSEDEDSDFEGITVLAGHLPDE